MPSLSSSKFPSSMMLGYPALTNGESSTLVSSLNQLMDFTMSLYWPNPWIQLFNYLFTGCRYGPPSYVTAFTSLKSLPLHQLTWALFLRKLATWPVSHLIVEQEGSTFLNCGTLCLNGRFWQLYHTEQALVPGFEIIQRKLSTAAFSPAHRSTKSACIK